MTIKDTYRASLVRRWHLMDAARFGVEGRVREAIA